MSSPRQARLSGLGAFAALALLGAASCSKEPSGAPEGTAAARGPLAEGNPAPDLPLKLQDGRETRLSESRGKLVVVYFYPKDDTPGCTVEAEGFRDASAELEKAGVVVYGVSTQDAASHKRFIEDRKLSFDLVVDEGGKVAKAFGVPLRGGLAARQTFLVDREGKVKKIWREVRPDGHAAEILAAASGA